jgi:hypothetical protein
MSFTRLTVGIVLAALAWPASASASPNAVLFGLSGVVTSVMARGAWGGFARGGYVLRDRGGVVRGGLVRGGYAVPRRGGGYLRVRPGGYPCHLKFNTLYFGCY